MVLDYWYSKNSGWTVLSWGELDFDIGTGVPRGIFKPTVFMYTKFHKCILPIHV